MIFQKHLTVLLELKMLVSQLHPLTMHSDSSCTEHFVEMVLIFSHLTVFITLKIFFSNENLMVFMFSVKELSLVLNCCIGPCGAAASRQVH